MHQDRKKALITGIAYTFPKYWLYRASNAFSSFWATRKSNSFSLNDWFAAKAAGVLDKVNVKAISNPLK